MPSKMTRCSGMRTAKYLAWISLYKKSPRAVLDEAGCWDRSPYVSVTCLSPQGHIVAGGPDGCPATS